MPSDEGQIEPFTAGILHAARLTEIAQKVNEHSRLLNTGASRDAGRSVGPCLSTFTVTAAAGGSGLYVGSFSYYGDYFTFSQSDNDPLGGESINFDCYGLNLFEEAKAPATHWITDASASGDSNVLGQSRFPAWPTSGFERDDGKRLVVFWGLPGYKC